MVDYPAGLPGPSINGYGANTVQPFIRTQFSTGLARQRRAYSYVPTVVTAQWVLTPGEMRIFESWFNGPANDGEAWFKVSLTLPTGTSAREARFTAMYEGPTPFGPHNYSYNASLELRERPIFPGEDYLYDPTGIEYADVFDRVVNTLLEA